MSDDDRALVGRPHRLNTPPKGVPVVDPAIVAQLEQLHQLAADLDTEADEFDEQFTPVRDVLALANSSQDANLVLGLWRHSANQELRFRRTRNRSSENKLRKDIDENTKSITDIHGASGQNGKLGELRRRVDALSSKAWWVMSAFVGGIGAAAIKLVLIVRTFDAVEARSESNFAQVQTLQAQVLTLQTALLAHRFHPAESPGKDSP